MSLITEPSICIPRTLNNVTWREVKDTFETLFGRGTVERVDVVRKREATDPFCRIFVHMRYWPVNRPDVAAIRDRLIAGDTVKVVYDNPWFWKCSASHAPKPERTRQKEAPFVDMGDAWRQGETKKDEAKDEAKDDAKDEAKDDAKDETKGDETKGDEAKGVVAEE